MSTEAALRAAASPLLVEESGTLHQLWPESWLVQEDLAVSPAGPAGHGHSLGTYPQARPSHMPSKP